MSKLLVFNDDYGDEHNVPALAIMSEEEYQIWLKSPSGKLNDKFDEQLALYNANKKANKDFWKLLEKNGCMLNGSANTGTIPKDRKDLIEAEKEYRKLGYVQYPTRVYSGMCAYLGNSSDYFPEGYSEYYLMEDFVKNGNVKVTEVSEQFAEEFKKVGIAGLSMCNIFEMDESYFED